MGKSSDRSQTLSIDVAAVVLCVLVTALLYLAAFRPLMVRNAEAAHAVGVLAQEEEQATRYAGQHRRVADRLNRFDVQRSDRATLLQGASQLNARLDALIQLAVDQGLNIDGVYPGEVRTQPFVDVIPIQFKAEGSYHEAIAFLRALHATYPDVAVQAFDLEVISKENTGEAHCTFDLEWYTAKQR